MESKIPLSVRLPKEYIDEIDKLCQTTGQKRSDVLFDAIEEYLGKSKTKRDVFAEIGDLRKRLDSLEKKPHHLQAQSVKMT